MLVWLIQRAESTPQDPDEPRVMRMGMIADYLVRKGHEVVWWTSTFNHYSKTQRFDGDIRVRINPLYNIQYLHTLGYKKNISFRRLIDNYFFAKKFESISMLAADKPDIILCSFPILNVCLAVLKYARRNNIPWIIDVRDLWPDVLIQRSHRFLRPLIVILTFPIRFFLYQIFSHAQNIYGTTDEFVQWGIGYSKRATRSGDASYPIAYYPNNMEFTELLVLKDINGNIIKRDVDYLTLLFIGSLSSGFNLEEIIRNIIIANEKYLKVRLIICGLGPRFQSLTNLAGSCKNIHFLGWINSSQISSVLDISDIGVCPYHENSSLSNGLGNKVAEYTSRGLVLFCPTPKSVLGKIIISNKCGVIYPSDSENFTKILENLLKNKEVMSLMRENAIKIFNEKFNSDVIYSELVNHLTYLTKKEANDFSQ
jgi:glycosyltransferase involved in cell wall biosynthesis